MGVQVRYDRSKGKRRDILSYRPVNFPPIVPSCINRPKEKGMGYTPTSKRALPSPPPAGSNRVSLAKTSPPVFDEPRPSRDEGYQTRDARKEAPGQCIVGVCPSCGRTASLLRNIDKWVCTKCHAVTMRRPKTASRVPSVRRRAKAKPLLLATLCCSMLGALWALMMAPAAILFFLSLFALVDEAGSSIPTTKSLERKRRREVKDNTRRIRELLSNAINEGSPLRHKPSGEFDFGSLHADFKRAGWTLQDRDGELCLTETSKVTATGAHHGALSVCEEK